MSIKISDEGLESLLSYLDELKETENKIRELLTEGFSSKLPNSVNIDVSQIQFYTKNKDPAGANTQWVWCFSKNQDGTYKSESKELVEYLERYGDSLKVGDFEFSLGGDKGQFLNRRKVK